MGLESKLKFKKKKNSSVHEAPTNMDPRVQEVIFTSWTVTSKSYIDNFIIAIKLPLKKQKKWEINDFLNK